MNCLIVGRTWEDEHECFAYGLPTHKAAPSTANYTDYSMFDGDVISCHTIKPWSDFACSVECSKRVVDSALQHPMSVVIGMSELHVIPDESPLWECAVVYDHRKGHSHPDGNSGQFALWWALEQGYEEIYTVGIDLIEDKERLADIKRMIDRYPSKVYKDSKVSWLPVPIAPWLSDAPSTS